MNVSISYLLSMQTALNQRRNQLKELRDSNTTRTYRFMAADQKETTEPTYDIKRVDKMLADINKALFKLDHKIKEANAKTTIEVDVDFDSLMSEI